MTREFEVRQEHELPATPEQVWAAVATGAGNLGWLYPMEVEPRVGGKVSRSDSTVTVWKPPHHFAVRATMDDGFFFSNTLSYRIEPVDGGTSHLHMGIHWVHEGVWDEVWDTKADAAEKHVYFYQHGLAQYLRYFADRPATYVKAQRPESTANPADFATLRRRLGLADGAVVGDRLALHVPGQDGGPQEVVVDWLSPDFVSLRGPSALYRFFNGSTWNWPIWVGHHLFAEHADEQQAAQAWNAWLNDAKATDF